MLIFSVELFCEVVDLVVSIIVLDLCDITTYTSSTTTTPSPSHHWLVTYSRIVTDKGRLTAKLNEEVSNIKGAPFYFIALNPVNHPLHVFFLKLNLHHFQTFKDLVECNLG